MSHLFHISPVAPPSHHVRPVTSVPSLRAAAAVVLRLDGGAGRPAAPGPPPGGLPEPPRAAARGLGPEGAAGDGDGPRPSRMSCFGGFQRISGLKIGSLVMFGPPFLIETCITAYRNQDQLIGKSHLCRAIHCKPDQRFTITHCNLSKKSLDSICIHIHPYAIINCIRPTAKCLLNLTQAHEPLCDIPATQTCNCCLLVVDFSTWNHVKYTENSLKLNWQQTQCRVASLSHFTCCTAFPPRPSCHIGPVSEGRDRRHPSPRRRRPRPAAPRPPPGGRCQPPGCIGPVPRSGGRRWRWRRAAPSHMSCFGGFQRISGLKNWEFGHVWSTISN